MAKRLIVLDYETVRRAFNAEFKATRKLVENGETHLDNLAEGFTEADRVLRRMPTIDAVEVCYCRDCKFYEAGVEYYGGGTKDICRLFKRQMQSNDFCSYGERKGGQAPQREDV